MKYFPFRIIHFKLLLAICAIALLAEGCVKKENYPDVPVITYNSFTPFCSGSITDSAYLKINFTDGNGDIGYPSQQQGVQPNYYVVPLFYIYSEKQFAPNFKANGDTDEYSYLIPDITPSGNNKELNGIIQLNLTQFFNNINENRAALDTLESLGEFQFMIWIYDRNGNKSNVLITPTVYACQ